MKHIVLIIFIMVTSTWSVFPQITYEGQYDSNLNAIQLDDGSVKYYKILTAKSKIQIFDINHSLWKEIELYIPKGHYIEDVQQISQRIFNKDDLFEILYTSYTIETSQNLENNEYSYSKQTYSVNIVNENGEELLTVPDSKEYKLFQFNGHYKLLVFKTTNGGFDSLYHTQVYTLN